MEQTILLRYEDGQFARIPTDPKQRIRWLAWRRDGESALAVGNRGLLMFFDGEKFERLDSPTGENLRCASYNHANTALIVGNHGTIIEFKGGTFTREEVDTRSNLRRVAWSPNGQLALVTGNDGTAIVWDSRRMQELGGALNNLRSVSWHPKGTDALVSGNYFGTSMVPCPNLYLYELGAKELKPLKTIEKVDLVGVEWKPDGTYALAVGYEIVWQEPRVLRWTGSEAETVPVAEPGVYPTQVAWDPRKKQALIGTGSPFPQGRGEGAILGYEEGRVRKLYSSPYRVTCISFHPREDFAVIIGQANARTFTV